VARQISTYNRAVPTMRNEQRHATAATVRRRRLSLLGAVVMLALALLLAMAAEAQTTAEAARELTEKILGHLQSRSAVLLDVRGAPGADNGEVTELRGALESELRRRGVRLVNADQAVEEVRVTASHNWREKVWAAEVGRGDARDVAIVTLPRNTAAPASAPAAVSLRMTALASQPVRALDAAIFSGALLVLDREGVAVYRNQGGRWALETARTFGIRRTWPRDMRGRLSANGSKFVAFLPGAVCDGEWQPQLTMTCREADDPWPLLAANASARAFFNPSRNFFTGAVSPPLPGEAGPMFSAARTGADASAYWIIAGADGIARVVAPNGGVTQVLTDWGSEVATIETACGSYVVTTRAGDAAAGLRDAVRVFHLETGRAVEATTPTLLNGPVTALWGSAADSAVVVVENANSGEYEISSVALACNR